MLLALSFILTILLSSCGLASVSGPVVEETRNLDPYTKIEVGNAIRITINEGEPGVIIVETKESVMDEVETRVIGEVLHLRHRDGVRFRRSPDIHISVPANNLNCIEMSGASDVRVTEKDTVFNRESIFLDLSGASDLVFTGKNITFGNDIDFSGAADIERVDSF